VAESSLKPLCSDLYTQNVDSFLGTESVRVGAAPSSALGELLGLVPLSFSFIFFSFLPPSLSLSNAKCSLHLFLP
jgi:hypothetical protein